MPALLTMISMPPKLYSALSKSAATSVGTETLAFTATVWGAHLRHQIRYDAMRTTLITALTLAFALGSPVLAQKEESTTEKVKDAARALLGEKKEAQEQRARVKITEGSLDMPNRFTAGEITFAVTNDADEKRGFRIAGKGIRESLGKINPVRPALSQ